MLVQLHGCLLPSSLTISSIVRLVRSIPIATTLYLLVLLSCLQFYYILLAFAAHYSHVIPSTTSQRCHCFYSP